jgi:hypothetical protein
VDPGSSGGDTSDDNLLASSLGHEDGSCVGEWIDDDGSESGLVTTVVRLDWIGDDGSETGLVTTVGLVRATIAKWFCLAPRLRERHLVGTQNKKQQFRSGRTRQAT